MSNEDKSNETIVIVDALNLFTRHFCAHPALGVNGEHVGGIVGFLYGVIHLVEDFKPTKVIIVWEGGGSSKKRAIFKEYKSKRKPAKLNRFYSDDMPSTVENRNHQVSVLVDIIKNLPIDQIYIPDCEADDVIGYLCKYTYKDSKKVIISSDHDFYQLLDKKTIIHSPTWKKLVTSKTVIEKYGISPENFCLAKSICGDPADNIKGVPRVGFKTLAKRFPTLSTQEELTANEIVEIAKIEVSEGSTLKAITNISESLDLIKRNWRLIYLDTQNLSGDQILKINHITDTFSPSRNKIQVMRILIKQGIQSFNVDRLFLSLKQIK